MDVKYSPVDIYNNKQRMIKIKKNIKIKGTRKIKTNSSDNVVYKRKYKSH